MALAVQSNAVQVASQAWDSISCNSSFCPSEEGLVIALAKLQVRPGESPHYDECLEALRKKRSAYQTSKRVMQSLKILETSRLSADPSTLPCELPEAFSATDLLEIREVVWGRSIPRAGSPGDDSQTRRREVSEAQIFFAAQVYVKRFIRRWPNVRENQVLGNLLTPHLDYFFAPPQL